MNLQEAHTKLNEASTLYRNKQFRAALDILTDLESEFPENERVLFNQALCLGKLGETDAALTYWELVAGRVSPEEARKLWKSILKSAPEGYEPPTNLQPVAPAPTPPPVASPDAPVQGPAHATPPPEPAPLPAGYTPIDALTREMLPAYLEYEFVRHTSDASDFSSETFLEDNVTITERGWRAFVTLIEHMVAQGPSSKWRMASELPEEDQAELVSLYADTFQKGELIVAARLPSGRRNRKRRILFTDRHLYYIGDRGEAALPWSKVDRVAVLPSSKFMTLGVLLRDGRKVFIDLAGFADFVAPLHTFLNELSLIYDNPAGALVVLPQNDIELMVPQICAHCQTDNLGVGGERVVHSQPEPVIGHEEDEDDFEDPNNASWTKRLLKKRRDKREELVDETDDTPDLGRFVFRLCPFCSAEQPVRLVRIQDKANALVFSNRAYAQTLARANRCRAVPKA
jgi:hypothetical protein